MPITPTHKEFEHPYVLFVEGKDEVNAFGEILTSAGIENIDLRDVGGKEKLRHNLPAAVKQSSFSIVKAFGIVQDADASESSTFDSICSVLRLCKLPQPKSVGSFVQEAGVKVGALVLPGGGETGYLEDLFLRASRDLPETHCVDTFASAVLATTGRSFDSKSRAYSLMVALGIIEPRLGRGFQKHLIDTSSPEYDVIREFSTKLIE